MVSVGVAVLTIRNEMKQKTSMRMQSIASLVFLRYITKWLALLDLKIFVSRNCQFNITISLRGELAMLRYIGKRISFPLLEFVENYSYPILKI
jgi:hypothetical protein